MQRKTGQRVDLITHSMGGLLVKSFLAHRRELMQTSIANWIAGAAPWQGRAKLSLSHELSLTFLSPPPDGTGAPGRAVESMVKGYHLGNILVSRTNARRLAATTPVAFQLIADADFKFAIGFVSLVVSSSHSFGFRSNSTGKAPYVSIHLVRMRALSVLRSVHSLSLCFF